MFADDGDDNADKYRLTTSSGGGFYLQNYASASWETNIEAVGNGGVNLYHDNTPRLETTSIGVKVRANSSVDGLLVTASQEGTVTVADQRDSSYKASFLMAGSGPVIRNQNTSTSDNTLAIQKGSSTKARWDGNGHYLPGSNNSYDLGNSSTRWRNLYVNDLQLSNEAKKDEGGNDVDGTWGDWTLQEGESDIYMINNRTGKKYSMMLKEVT